MKDGVFHAYLLVQTSEQVLHLQCRSNDGIILAILMEVPIYLSPEVMEEVGLEFELPEVSELNAGLAGLMEGLQMSSSGEAGKPEKPGAGSGGGEGRACRRARRRSRGRGSGRRQGRTGNSQGPARPARSRGSLRGSRQDQRPDQRPGKASKARQSPRILPLAHPQNSSVPPFDPGTGSRPENLFPSGLPGVRISRCPPADRSAHRPSGR